MTYDITNFTMESCHCLSLGCSHGNHHDIAKRVLSACSKIKPTERNTCLDYSNNSSLLVGTNYLF